MWVVSTVSIRNLSKKGSSLSTRSEQVHRLFSASPQICNRTRFCVSYFRAAKPWNQSGKFPLLRMSGACVSVNHLSTSSFRPPSVGSMCRSTPDFFSILTRSSRADRAVLSRVLSLLGWRWKGRTSSLIWLFPLDICHLNSAIVSFNLPVAPLPVDRLPASFYYQCSSSQIEL